MSVDMFLDDADSQVTAIGNMCRAHVQGLNSLKTAISQFIFEPVLIGKTYDSAKIYFQMTYIPVITGLILAAETLETAAKKLPDHYRSDVDENSLQEDVLRRHIDQLNKLMAFADHLAAGASKNSFLKTGFTKLGEHYQDQQKDEQAKLAKLMAFDPESATLFGEVETLLDAVEQGLKEMRSGKGFSGLTGTFSAMGLNMDWVKPINDKWTEYDRRQKGIDSKKEKELEAYDVYAIVYENTDGNAKILWHLEKDGKGVDAPELYQYLSKAGQYLPDKQYRIWSMDDYQKHLEDGWRHGINYQNGDTYNAFIKGTLATSQYVADGYNWTQKTGMYDLILMAGLSYASYKVTTGTGGVEKTSGTRTEIGKHSVETLNRDQTRIVAENLLENGELSLKDLKNMIPEGTPNTFNPTARIPEGAKYEFVLSDGQKVIVRWHGPDSVAAIKYPNSVSGSRWTAQVKVGNKQIKVDGTWTKNQGLNEVHVPIKGK